jgi:hypothetical protein
MRLIRVRERCCARREGRGSSLLRSFTPRVIGGEGAAARRLTTREAMAHPVELPLEASFQYHATAFDDEAAEHRAVDDLF